MIDVTKHSGLIFNIARKVKNSYPSIDIQDIIQEINILVIKYSSPIHTEFKGTVIEGNIDVSVISIDIGEILHINGGVSKFFDYKDGKYVENAKRKYRTVVFNGSVVAESTFIMTFIGRKIMQTIKYSGLIDCQSTMREGKQVYEYMNAVSMNSTVDSEDENIELVNSLQVLEGHESMYNNTDAETDFGKILSVSNITDKEKSILSLRFEQGKTLKEIGELLNISNERVRQIEEKAIAKMKSCKAIKELV